jgi:hypothetical protein
MMQQAVDFSQLVEQVNQQTVGSADIAIWSGTCSAANLSVFLDAWKLPNESMPFCIWEQLSAITFNRQHRLADEDIRWLQRGRIFGEGGDLELRRAGDHFEWRLIEDVGLKPPEGQIAESFWTIEPQARFHRYANRRLLLWGERSTDDDRWFEDRVARADLTYPASAEWPRIWLEYEVFSRNGTPEFVWFQRLIQWEASNA